MNKGQGTVTEYEFESRELDETISLLIYLPPGYSPLYKHSVVIAQDGRDYFQLGRLPRFADELIHNNEIENVIIIGVPYKNVKDRRNKYHPDGEKMRLIFVFWPMSCCRGSKASIRHIASGSAEH